MASWSIVEAWAIFVQMKISLQFILKTTWNHNLKIIKNTWKFTKKPGKIMEISWNFVSPEKWEP